MRMYEILGDRTHEDALAVALVKHRGDVVSGKKLKLKDINLLKRLMQVDAVQKQEKKELYSRIYAVDAQDNIDDLRRARAQVGLQRDLLGLERDALDLEARQRELVGASADVVKRLALPAAERAVRGRKA